MNYPFKAQPNKLLVRSTKIFVYYLHRCDKLVMYMFMFEHGSVIRFFTDNMNSYRCTVAQEVEFVNEGSVSCCATPLLQVCCQQADL